MMVQCVFDNCACSLGESLSLNFRAICEVILAYMCIRNKMHAIGATKKLSIILLPHSTFVIVFAGGCFVVFSSFFFPFLLRQLLPPERCCLAFSVSPKKE